MLFEKSICLFQERTQSTYEDLPICIIYVHLYTDTEASKFAFSIWCTSKWMKHSWVCKSLACFLGFHDKKPCSSFIFLTSWWGNVVEKVILLEGEIITRLRSFLMTQDYLKMKCGLIFQHSWSIRFIKTHRDVFTQNVSRDKCLSGFVGVMCLNWRRLCSCWALSKTGVKRRLTFHERQKVWNLEGHCPEGLWDKLNLCCFSEHQVKKNTVCIL